MKKIYLLACAGLTLAACSTNDDNVVDPVSLQNSKYMAVNIVTNNATTRADGTDESFAKGSENEYAVDENNIYFYFFDKDGNAFAVDNAGNNYCKPAQVVETSATADDKTNVTIKKLILTLSNKSGNVPAQVIAVINSPVAPAQVATVDALRKQDVTGTNVSGSTTYFTMSNSAYNTASGSVYTAPITSANLKTSADEAKAAPVDIYVERVMAKLTTSTSNSDTAPAFPIYVDKGANDNKLTVTLSSGKTLEGLQAKIIGWNYFDNTTNTSLIKNIEGIDWAGTYASYNDLANYRCYWANPLTVNNTGTDKITFNTVIANTADLTAAQYTYEQTANATSIIFAAQIQDKDGNKVELVKWLSQFYTPADFKAALASYLSNELYTHEANTTVWTPITADDITFQGQSDDITNKIYDYNVKVVLADATKQYYAKNSDAALTTDQVNAILARVPKVQYWKDGYCYYYAAIQHTTGDYAVIRNHWYQMAVTSISGLGTPVYDPSIAVDPKHPEDENWYLATRLNVLAWKQVKQSVGLVSK